MNDEQMRSLLDTWYRDRDEAPRDANGGIARVMARVPQTRQRRRWSPFPVLRRKTQTPTAIDTTGYRPSPIPATNGRAPTVIGRTQTMFSPVKAITAGALVFALGGLFLIAQPFGQQGESAPGADSGDVAASWVTGDITLASTCSPPTYEQDGAVRHDWGFGCGPHKWTTSDPRLSGDVTEAWNADVYQTENGFISVFASAYFVTNEAGGWTCHSDAIAEGYGMSPDFVTGETATCVGDGGYDGLSATLVVDTWGEGSLVGLIFPGDAPPLPEPPAAE